MKSFHIHENIMHYPDTSVPGGDVVVVGGGVGVGIVVVVGGVGVGVVVVVVGVGVDDDDNGKMHEPVPIDNSKWFQI
jgi:hypothetical protein